MTVRLSGHMELPDDRRDAVLAALPGHIRLTLAEPGCLSFVVTDAGGRLDVLETFRDEAAFAAHQHRIIGTQWARITQGLARDYVVTRET